MADEQQQQTRVLLLNGQTIILQGDATDNAINEINADLLQQALQEATGSTDPVEEPPRNEEYQQPPPAAENATPTNAAENNLVAIFHGDQGETHTIQLTVEQAEALGLHFMSDDSEKVTITPDIPQNVSTSQMAISNDQNQLMYSDNASQPDESKTIFDPCISTESNIASIQDSTSLQGDTNTTSLQQNIGALSALSDVGSYVGDSNNITLIPQFVNGQMTYTVKLSEQSSNALQNQDFSVMDNEDHEPEHVIDSKPKLPLLAPALPTNSLTTSNSTPVVTSVSGIRVNSIPSMINTLTPIAPALAQTSTTTTFATPKSLLSPLTNIAPLDKSTKATYVVVPSSCTTVSASSAAVTHTSSGPPLAIKGSTLLRPRTVIPASASLQSTKTTTAVVSASIPTSSHTPSTTSTLTGIPLMNSNINITRTSAAGSSLLQSVSTSLTGGGMIRVVAGGSTARMVQAPTTNGPKFTNILTPSGRLVTATSSQPTTQKIIPVNSTAGVAKTSVTTTAVSTTVTTEPLQSSAVSAVQSAAARLNINSTKPLGSSENPIQLVQHGQTFHSVQALSQEQLRQIATVLQQQHLDSAPRTKNVLYDAETNTRIIYRVVYPEDLDLREPSSPSEKHIGSGLASGGRGRGRRGRPPKTAIRHVGRTVPIQDSSLSAGRKAIPQAADLDLDEDRLMDNAAKVERKKQVARTRSGRLSRPPRHMVKDYKRLHHLDFADADLDDSDGGYSDYQMSDREAEEQDALAKATATPTNTQGTAIPTNHNATPAARGAAIGGAAATTAAVNPVATTTTTTTLLPGLQSSKRKFSSHFRCPTCQKVYLGHSRMARHFDMFPDHGSIDQMKTSTSAAPSSPVPLPDSTQGRQVGIGSTLNGIVRPSGSRRRGKRRGPWAYTTPEARSERRKIKLREALGTCEASELSEVAGPAVAGVMSLWELLLLRVETVRTEESLMATLCEELRALLEKVQSVAGEMLQPAHSEEICAKEEQVELQDEILCNALGLPSGKYQIVDDHLLTRRAQSGFDMKVEPPSKRLKSDESDNKVELKLDEIKPSCPEVLSALALESRPTSVTSLITNPVPSSVSSTIASTETSNSHPSSPAKSSVDSEPTKTSQDNTPQSQDENMKDVDCVGAKPVSDQEDEHHFLLPTTSDMCVDELSHEAVGGEGESHGTETVDDIVNERLKNLTGFSVNGPESETVQSAPQEVAQFQNPTHNPNDTEVPTFDPEMALAAMGEGEQPDSGTALSEFTPEIALAAMGEGDPDPQDDGTRHSPFASSVQPVFDPIKSMQDSVVVSSNSTPPNEDSDQPKMNSPIRTREVFSDLGLSHMDSSQTRNSAETKEGITFTTSILTNNSENTFITSLAESSSIGKCEGPSDSSVTSFDPEIALAAMGEGDPTGGNSESTFDPEMALASMEEGVANVSNGQEFSQTRDTSESEPTFQLTGMDVSLDESGPELDFDALSAEFTRSTRHS